MHTEPLEVRVLPAMTAWVHDSAGTLATVDVATGDLSPIGRMGTVMTDIAFSPDGRLFAISFNSLYELNPTNGQSTFIGSHNVPGGNGLEFADDGTLYATGYSSTGLFVIDPTSGDTTRIGTPGFYSGGDLAYVDGSLFMTTSADDLVRIDLDNISGAEKIGPLGESNVYGLDFAPDGSLYGMAGTETFRIDLDQNRVLAAVAFENQGSDGLRFYSVYGASFAPDTIVIPEDQSGPFDDEIYIHDADGTLAVIDLNGSTATSPTATSTIIGQMSVVMTDIAFAPDGRLFGISFTDLYVIDGSTADVTHIGSHGISGGNALEFAPDGTLFAAGRNTSWLYTIDPDTGSGSRVVDSGYESGGDLAFIDGQLLLSTSADQLVAIDPTGATRTQQRGTMAANNVFGLDFGVSDTLYAIAGTEISTVDPDTGSTTRLIDYASLNVGGGLRLNNAFGASVRTVSAADNDPGIDFDGDGAADALSDGILCIRYLAGFSGDALVAGVVDPGGTRADANRVAEYMQRLVSTVLDPDDDGAASPLSDGILITRFLAGFTNDALTDGVIGRNARRNTWSGIRDYLSPMLPGRRGFGPSAKSSSADVSDAMPTFTASTSTESPGGSTALTDGGQSRASIVSTGNDPGVTTISSELNETADNGWSVGAESIAPTNDSVYDESARHADDVFADFEFLSLLMASCDK